MGYFDAVAKSMFKTDKDGRKIFFPWWPIPRGYVVPSEEEYQRLLRHHKIYLVCQFIYIIYCAWKGVIWAMFLVAIPYSIWAYVLCRNLEKSGEKLSLNEKIANQAREMSFFLLWLLLIAGIAFVAAGIFIITYDWGKWQSLLIGFFVIAFFGLCSIFFVKMLIVKKSQGIQNL